MAEQIRDQFGATGTVDEEGFFQEYASQKEANKIKGEKSADKRQGSTFFKQRPAVDEDVDSEEDDTDSKPKTKTAAPKTVADTSKPETK